MCSVVRNDICVQKEDGLGISACFSFSGGSFCSAISASREDKLYIWWDVFSRLAQAESAYRLSADVRPLSPSAWKSLFVGFTMRQLRLLSYARTSVLGAVSLCINMPAEDFANHPKDPDQSLLRRNCLRLVQCGGRVRTNTQVS